MNSEPELPGPDTAPAVEEAVLSSPEDVEKAENLIRQAKLATMRKQPSVARKLLEEAMEAAPRSLAVLEVIGDDLMERRQVKKAMETYKSALELDPSNASVERKYAEAVLASQGIADPMAMLAGGGASIEHYGRGNSAAIVNIFLPGVGHFLIGENTKAILFMALTVLGYTLAAILPNGVRNLLIMAAGKSTDINGLAIVALLLGIVTHLIAVMDAVSFAKRYKPRVLNKPMPLVDKDFEI